MASRAFPIPINCGSDRVHSAGDSWIAGISNAGIGMGLFGPLGQRIQCMQMAARAVSAVQGAGATPSYLIPWTQDGIPGNRWQDLAPVVSTRILAYNPTVLFMLASSNDWGVSVPTMTSSLDTILGACFGQLPTMKICILSNCGSSGEQWSTASGWTGNPNDSQTAGLNSAVKTYCDARGDVWYCNLRGDAITDANTYLQYVSQKTPEMNGTTVPSAARVIDGTNHPIRTEGERNLMNLFWNYLQVTL
jgi:hypothetical protein